MSFNGGPNDVDIHRADDLVRMLLDHDRFVSGEAIEERNPMAIKEPNYHERGLGWFGAESLMFEYVVLTRPKNIFIGDRCRIDDFVKLEGGERLEIGQNVHIASFAHINIGGGTTKIGKHAAFASGSKVISGGNRPEGQSMSAASPLELQVLQPTVVEIGDYACLAVNAIVMPGVTVGEGALLGANAVARHDLEPWTVYVPFVDEKGIVQARKLGLRPMPWRHA
jgi:acetyltransferase-like isoleucine patch superfamily enzyme